MRPFIAIAAVVLALAASLLLAPATLHAIPPALPEYHYYYGPGRACGQHYAFDAAEGEGYEQSGWMPSLYFPGGGLAFESWMYAGPAYRDIVEPLGSVDLPGGVRLDRIRMSSRNSPAVGILYLYDTGDRSRFPLLSIRSNRFDGSAGDLALLERIRFGAAAEAMCADIPEPLRPTPERENFDASWLEQRAYAGPLTLCMAGVALDLEPGEAVQLPWTESWPRFRVVRGGLGVDVDLLMWSRDNGPRLSGPLARHPAVAFLEGGIHHWYGFRPDGELGPLHVQLYRRLPGDPRRLTSMPHLNLAFDRRWPRTDRLDFAERLRAQGPEDRCLEASSPPPPRTSGL